MNEVVGEPASCPRCGASFTCFANTSAACPCAGITLSTEQREFIARNWQGCLCRDCLENIRMAGKPDVSS